MMSAFADQLAGVNACLNATSTLALLAGFIFVKSRRYRAHRAAMWTAFGASAVFLAGYVTRYILSGTHRFPDVGTWRTAYLVLLFSHMVLAIVALPLILRSLYLAAKDRRAEHRRIAKIAYPIWLYVSVTGVVVYFMLYHVAPRLVGVS